MRRWAWGLVLTLPLWWGCAPALVRLPAGPGAVAPGYASAWTRATAACRGVRVLTAAIGVSGHVGPQRVHGRLLAGLARPDGLRLEAVAPFGQPAFVLVARGGRATLLLPRDGRVLREADPAAVLEALAGVSLSPAGLLAALSGCGTAGATPVTGRAYGDDWIRVGLEDGSVAYLRRVQGVWRLVAALPAAGGGRQLRVDYADFDAATPADIRLSVAAADVALHLQLSQIDLNVPLAARAFQVDVPAGTQPLTLRELREASPLGGPVSGHDGSRP
ncbi:MAG: hypothetical protein KGN76_07090 [Acidobacteriota bacterium]|nr:hypothetical protein [Acidobacteriota bacterium]